MVICVQSGTLHFNATIDFRHKFLGYYPVTTLWCAKEDQYTTANYTFIVACKLYGYLCTVRHIAF